jgi:Copper transport outer membrane protein, MctB
LQSSDDRVAVLIDFRYHIVSLIAVFLALALGLFLGSTTLQSTVTRNLHHQANTVIANNKRLIASNDQLGTQLKDEKKYTAAVLPYAVEDRLAGNTIAVISAPGVDSGTRKDLENALTLASGTVVADVQLQPSFLDPTQDTELGTLAGEIALPGHTLPRANGATQLSAVLAAALATRPGRPSPARGKVTQALSAMADGKFISISGSTPTRPADLGIVLVPASGSDPATAATTAQNAILLSLARDLRANTTATVLAGPTAADGGDAGALSAAVSNAVLAKSVSIVHLDPSSVQAEDESAGLIAVVLALAGTPPPPVGEYGLGQDPPLPVASATP